MAFFGARVYMSMEVYYKCNIYDILWSHGIPTPPLLRGHPPPTNIGAPSGSFGGPLMVHSEYDVPAV